MKLLEVKTKKDSQLFVALSVALYKNIPAWIRPIDEEIENIFNPYINNNYKNGECIRWILEDNNKIISRVAAFINFKTASKLNCQPTGGIGFFECINNQKTADILFDSSKVWLKERGVEAMDGAINFGNRNKWWGVLTKGYDIAPSYQCNYNFHYYK